MQKLKMKLEVEKKWNEEQIPQNFQMHYDHKKFVST